MSRYFVRLCLVGMVLVGLTTGLKSTSARVVSDLSPWIEAKKQFTTGATLVVTSGDDSGVGTLRDQIAAAVSGDTIQFSGVTAVTLTTDEIVIDKDLTIDGGSGVTITRSTAGGTPDFRLFNILTGTVNFNNLTISNGNAYDGGGIFNFGVLTLTECTLSGNRASHRGGGFCEGDDGIATFVNCTIASNRASVAGGGVSLYSGALYFSGCTINSNQALTDNGGAIDAGGGTVVELVNCTIVGNSCSINGGGLGVGGDVVVSLISCTLAGNTSRFGGGAIYSFNPNVTCRNTILSQNTPNNVGGDVVSQGHNLSSDATGGGGPGDLLNTGALLGPLEHNGGVTQTLALLPGSPAINAGAAVSEQQSVTIAGTSGTFTVTFNGATTPVLAFNATQAAVQLALNSLPTIGGIGGSVTVTQTGMTYLIHFQGTLAGTNVPQITGTGVSGASVAIETLVEGDQPTDQRGVARLQQGAVDIGAFESRGFTMMLAEGNAQSTHCTAPFAEPLRVTVTSLFAEPVDGGQVVFLVPGSGASCTVASNPATIIGGTATSGTATANDLAGGPYQVTATANGSPSVDFNLTNLPVPVLSITRMLASPVCLATPVQWTVTFAVGVNGVTTSNFELTGGTGARLLSVVRSGATWTVTATSGTAETAALGLTLVNAAGITPVIVNVPFAGDSYGVTGNCTNGLLYVADTSNHRIQRFDGAAWSVVGVGVVGSGTGQFRLPEAVAFDARGRIYVADTGNNRIQWSTDAGVTWADFATSGIGLNQVKSPQGLALDLEGNLYVSDTGNSRVMRFDDGLPGTGVVIASSGTGSGQVNSPQGLAIDSTFRLFVTDESNSRIVRILDAHTTVSPASGSILATSGIGLNRVRNPQGITLDASGTLYIADTGNSRILRWGNANPANASTLALSGAALGQVNRPEGVTVTIFAQGSLAGIPVLIVGDTFNHRIQGRFLPTGQWNLIGVPNNIGSGVGQFRAPSKIR
ncbi:MAG TPA: choice-of-anchor Q domain-containing protein [Acidobacteriota bacterium]|nr:choice-of-anchor Q domain-containing protein [Acidobacteriota bacterium]